MTAFLGKTVASYGERRAERERGEKIYDMGFVRPLHLGSIASAESPPSGSVVCRLAHLEEFLAGRHLGKPDVVEIARSKVGLRDSTRRASNGPDAQALTGEP